jgi:hypothetical protein
MLAVTPTSATSTAAPVSAGEFSWLQMPGWRMDFDAGIEGAKIAMAAEAKRAEKRAGARGKGSKPRRSRTTAEFSEGFETVSSDRSYVRTERKNKADERKAEEAEAAEACGMTLREALDNELKQAYRDVERDSARWISEAAALDMKVNTARRKGLLSEPTASKRARSLINRVENAKIFAERAAGEQSSWDRVVKTGFVHPGGMICGRYRAPFVEKGLRSWRHPFFQRVVASIGRAASGTLRTGPTKDQCTIRYKKMPALDQTYAFFGAACRDMWRLDCEETFASEAHLRAWIADKVEEHDLPCGPHIICQIPDSRLPGEWYKPHLLFLLPEGHAVWKTSDPKQHAMLGQVIAGLTRAFECDPDGLADPFSGKNPISPTVQAEIYQDTHMPLLIEYFEALGCTLDPQQMFRFMSTEKLSEAGFDASDSNTWFTTVAKLANLTAQDLFKQGFPTADAARLKKRIIKLITAPTLEAIKPGASQRKAIDSLIECCARYAADSFDPAKMDTNGKDRGAAAHLIEATDSKHDRQSKGRAYSATVQITETRAIITKAIRLELAAGREPTIASITAIVPRCYNSVKQHFFACYQTATASIALKSLLRGHANLPGMIRPSRAVLLTAVSPSDVPLAWREAARDPVIVDHFRLQALRKARRRTVSVPIPGSRMIDFMSAGPVTVYRAATVSRAA